MRWKDQSGCTSQRALCVRGGLHSCSRAFAAFLLERSGCFFYDSRLFAGKGLEKSVVPLMTRLQSCPSRRMDFLPIRSTALALPPSASQAERRREGCLMRDHGIPAALADETGKGKEGSDARADRQRQAGDALTEGRMSQGSS